jgi:hypothetical protein
MCSIFIKCIYNVYALKNTRLHNAIKDNVMERKYNCIKKHHFIGILKPDVVLSKYFLYLKMCIFITWCWLGIEPDTFRSLALHHTQLTCEVNKYINIFVRCQCLSNDLYES